MSPSDVALRRVTAPEPALLPGLAALLIDAVEDGASVGFLANLPEQAALDYWHGVMERLPGGLHLWVAEQGGEIVGAVQLDPCGKENGRHRAEVQKLFVLRRFRSRGIAGHLLDRVEAEAAADGRSLLVLDTLKGSTAESFYARRGWIRAGEIPDFAADPDGVLAPTVLFYKPIGAIRRLAR